MKSQLAEYQTSLYKHACTNEQEEYCTTPGVAVMVLKGKGKGFP